MSCDDAEKGRLRENRFVESDLAALAFLRKLSAAVGARHVITDAGMLAPYLTDERNRFTGNALAVVSPGSTEEVASVVKLCASQSVAIVPQGGNTSLCGGATPLATKAAAGAETLSAAASATMSAAAVSNATPTPASAAASATMSAAAVSIATPTPAPAAASATPSSAPSIPPVVLSLRRMRGVRSLDRLSRTITVGAGTTVAEVAEAAAGADLLFPLRFGADGSAQIGGALSTNAGGTAVLRYGHARALTLGLEVVLANGEVLRLGRGLRKDNAGYDLKQLFIGSEGTLGVICEATLALHPPPRSRVTCVATVSAPRDALEVLGRLQDASDGHVTACEWMSPTTRRLACEMPGGARDPFGAAGAGTGAARPLRLAGVSERGDAYHDTYAPHLESLVLYELTSSRTDNNLEEILEETLATALDEGLIGDATIADSSASAASLWRLRTAPSEAEKRVGVSVKHDISVTPEQISGFLAEVVPEVRRILPGLVINAMGHIGDGNVHFNLLPPPGAEHQLLLDAEAELTEAVFKSVDALGGSFSAEHGIGQLRRSELAQRRPSEFALMRRVKAALDPTGLLNPGKVV